MFKRKRLYILIYKYNEGTGSTYFETKGKLTQIKLSEVIEEIEHQIKDCQGFIITSFFEIK